MKQPTRPSFLISLSDVRAHEPQRQNHATPPSGKETARARSATVVSNYHGQDSATLRSSSCSSYPAKKCGDMRNDPNMEIGEPLKRISI